MARMLIACLLVLAAVGVRRVNKATAKAGGIAGATGDPSNRQCLHGNYSRTLPSLVVDGYLPNGMEKWSAYRAEEETGWDGHWRIEAQAHRSIGRVKSYHDNKKEDRRFTFEEVHPQLSYTNAYLGGPGTWTGWLNDWDQEVHYTCKDNSVITGIESDHSNKHEDRRWKVRCSSIGTWHWQDSENSVREVSDSLRNSGWVNEFDKSFDAELPSGFLLVGIHSYHHNKHEDRRFSFDYKRYCK